MFVLALPTSPILPWLPRTHISGKGCTSCKTVLLGQTVEPVQADWCSLADYKRMVTQKLNSLYKALNFFFFFFAVSYS